MDVWIIVGTIASCIAAIGAVGVIAIAWWTRKPEGVSFKIDYGVQPSTGDTVVRATISPDGGTILFRPEVVVEGAVVILEPAATPAVLDVRDEPLVVVFTIPTRQSTATVGVVWVAASRRHPHRRGSRLRLPEQTYQQLRRGGPGSRLRWKTPRTDRRRARALNEYG